MSRKNIVDDNGRRAAALLGQALAVLAGEENKGPARDIVGRIVKQIEDNPVERLAEIEARAHKQDEAGNKKGGGDAGNPALLIQRLYLQAVQQGSAAPPALMPRVIEGEPDPAPGTSRVLDKPSAWD